MRVLVGFVTQSVRVPDPVYEQVSHEAERKDVSRGVIIREWMNKAEQFEEVQHR
jgi:predicted transcriptional regulator